LIASRERQRAIKVKYGNKSVPVKEQRELDRLEDEERILSRRLTSIQQYKSSTIYKVFYIVRPFEIILGVILLCTTLVIAVSIFMTIVDKIANAICGSQCGYVINHPKLFNPINFIFVNLSKIFPLDYMFMVCLIVYFFLATMSGIVHVGIRFLWINLYSIKKGATAPQALLVSAVLLTLSLLALNYTMTTTVAPGYAHFGSQVYCNQTILDGVRDCTENKEMIVPCDIYGPTDICTPTVSSTMIDKIIVNTPFFGVFFYYSQWIFLAVFGLGFLVALFKRPRNNSTQDDLQELDEEEENLLSQRNSSYHAT
jgi:LMBR1 domain-containing protein 1